MTDPVIRASGLRRAYGAVEAVRGIDLEVAAGEVFAFLGPNGAGKTTTVEILEGYRERDGGEAEVLGCDPARPTRAWRERIGIVLQECRLTPELTPREALELYAGYYPRPRPVDEVLELVGLQASADTRTIRLSGGQQRRLDVALALVGDPELLFLDEPTTGFDPSARRQAWAMIAGLRDLGKTVFLTTHYMDEAQALADRVAILSAGEVVAEGTPGELASRSAAPSRLAFVLPTHADRAALPDALRAARPTTGARGFARPAVPGVHDGAGGAGDGPVALEVDTDEPVRLLHELTAWALERGVDLAELEVHRPSLEDVYLQLTGDPGERAEAGR